MMCCMLSVELVYVILVEVEVMVIWWILMGLVVMWV